MKLRYQSFFQFFCGLGDRARGGFRRGFEDAEAYEQPWPPMKLIPRRWNKDLTLAIFDRVPQRESPDL
jgi:hypothetical protein